MPFDRVYDFHMHTTQSDGVLTPVELIRRCIVKGYGAMLISDHSGPGTLERFIRENTIDCRVAREYWNFEAFAGVELTHVPAGSVAAIARQAKEAGAALVVVHGESPVEPVEPGTNLAAASCPDVDVLAHPGLLSPETAQAARENGVFIEISARKGHSLSNGHVAQTALAAGAKLVVNSDSHAPDDLLTPAWAEHVALCAGVPRELLETILLDHPAALLDRARASTGR